MLRIAPQDEAAEFAPTVVGVTLAVTPEPTNACLEPLKRQDFYRKTGGCFPEVLL
jgi:hypothetical protein